MPPVDERDLRDLARHLANLYQELDSLKYSRPTPPEVRAMKPAPGPQSPGNWLYVSCWLDQEPRLREVAFNAFSDIGVKVRDDEAGAVALCQKLAFHAQAVSELDWANDLTDELEHQTKVIGRHCRPRATREIAETHERRLGAEAIARQLRARRHHVTADTVRGWARAGYITREVMPNGRGGYLLSESLANLVEKQ
ncbi:hypothetical protein [Corynebacterium striatum]|uniref:hypothetical protein n=1 Tax=Corynebacterium striatum TaxID=43770 RepID=UPI003F80B6D1